MAEKLSHAVEDVNFSLLLWKKEYFEEDWNFNMKHTQQTKYTMVNLKDIEYQLDKITLYTEIINNSPDYGNVEHELTRILDSIDYILACDDMELAELGVDKNGLPEHRTIIVANHDAPLAQVQHRQ